METDKMNKENSPSFWQDPSDTEVDFGSFAREDIEADMGPAWENLTERDLTREEEYRALTRGQVEQYEEDGFTAKQISKMNHRAAKEIDEKLSRFKSHTVEPRRNPSDWPGKELRLVLLGPCGAGKSATGNLIIGRHVFRKSSVVESETLNIQKEECVYNGVTVSIIDTPGYPNIEGSVEELYKEVAKGLFGSGALKNTFFILTHGNLLLKHQSLDQFIKDAKRTQLGQYLDKVDNRVIAVDNSDETVYSREQQRNQVLDFIMSKFFNTYTDEFFNWSVNYPMKSNPRGRCVILNVDKFTAGNLDNRDGAHVDVSNVSKLFTKLNFDVITWKNLTKKEICAAIKKERKAERHKIHDAFMMIIMSHGEKGYIYSKDGLKISIEKDIIAEFNGIKCTSLINKPKMFFIQACQGKRKTTGVVCDGAADTSISLSDIEREFTVDENPNSQMVHEEADILIAYSTVPGYVAWRDRAEGSWFIQELVKVFEQYCHTEHVEDMLTRVNLLVEQKPGSTYKQLCHKVSNLRKKVYLLPG